MSFDRDESLLNRSLLLLALGGVLTACWRSIDRVHRSRRHARSTPLPHREAQWEGEGGRPLPDDTVAPDSPSPAVPAPPSA